MKRNSLNQVLSLRWRVIVLKLREVKFNLVIKKNWQKSLIKNSLFNEVVVANSLENMKAEIGILHFSCTYQCSLWGALQLTLSYRLWEPYTDTTAHRLTEFYIPTNMKGYLKDYTTSILLFCFIYSNRWPLLWGNPGDLPWPTEPAWKPCTSSGRHRMHL